MIDRFLVRIANAHSFLSKLWVLARPYWFAEERQSRATLSTLLAGRLPKRFAQQWCAERSLDQPVVQLSDRALDGAAREIKDWKVQPSGTLGYNKAEVTLGGVDTRNLSSKTLEARA
jgi:predicted flavoprotein YhiN